MIGYLITQKGNRFTFQKPKELQVVAYADANYATNTDDRQSISGNVVTIGGTITHWTSKTQTTVSQSSCEAEYRSAAMCASEMVFTQNLIEEIEMNRYPAILNIDNTAAIFLINNQHVGVRTKHIDVKYHFIRELTEAGRIMIHYIRSENNVADGNTKNISEVLFKKHRDKLRSGRIENIRGRMLRRNVFPRRQFKMVIIIEMIEITKSIKCEQ
jgi:hypothetical protein